MRIALTELRRRPGRFLPVGVALTLLVLLLAVLGGFLDGLELSQTGAYRAQRGRVLAFAEDADLQQPRSRIAPEVRRAVAAADGVRAVGALDMAPTTAAPPGGEVQDIVLVGYELGTAALPPPPADGAVVDAALADLVDLAEGDVLEVGPARTEVRVAALVGDLTQGAPTVWVGVDAWREVAATLGPQAQLPEGAAQVLVVEADPAAGGPAVLDGVDAVDGVQAVTPEGAVDGLPVVQQQSATFQGILVVTFAVVLLVVALFFALLTLERTALYAVLKALGARSGEVLAGVAAQAVGVTAVALVLGLLLSAGFVALLPPDLPIRLEPVRLLQISGGALATALLGSLSTLRRILRIDPASAIG